MKRLFAAALLASLTAFGATLPAVRSYEGTVSIPTYEHSGRDLEPPLFSDSTAGGMYPFTTYLMPYKGPATTRAYPAIFIENEYLKITYIPDFGDRIFSVYDKLRHREMLYRNDVIKPAPYNPRNSWPQSGLELTGPHDLHTLTLHGEPFWANKVVRQADGSVSLVLGEIDPVYGMNVDLTATLHPGFAALEIKVFCYNQQDGRKPQMFWINTAINATPGTRFIYPMSRTVGHTTADIADWPLYNGIDYSLDRNNKHMLGVFGIDIYDNFQGAYQFDRDYGIFRYADRRIVQGMKLWTFGYGDGSQNYVDGYTDHAGPYVELQSGRHVWDGHYEWVAPHKVEGWTELWIPVSQTGGLTTLTRDVALKLDVRADPAGKSSSIDLALAATHRIHSARILITAKSGQLFQATATLDPAATFHHTLDKLALDSLGLSEMAITVTDAAGKVLLDYHRPDEIPGRKEYTSFTKPLEEKRKAPEEMSAEELTLAAEFRLKELDEAGATSLFEAALRHDPGYSRAHLLMGVMYYNNGHFDEAAEHLSKAIERDAYADEGYYYLALSQLSLNEEAKAERNLYYIWPDSAYYGAREFQLGLLSTARKNSPQAINHFKQARAANENDLLARLALAAIYRETGDKAGAFSELSAVEQLDATNHLVPSERWLWEQSQPAKSELLRLLGGQTQEAMETVVFYRRLGRWQDASRILQLVYQNNRDPWSTTPEFFYTLAYCQRRAGDAAAADASLAKGQTAFGKVDRFPYRAESEAPLGEAVKINPNDGTALFSLACLEYFRGNPKAAIHNWELELVLDPSNFSARRALGLAYAEQGYPVEKAARQLEKAIELNPAHVRTLDDLSALYARAGRFDDQLAVLNKALSRSPSDDDLAEGILTADLNKGQYAGAGELIDTHHFATRHRSYGLRDKYRLMRYGMGAEAFNRGAYQQALTLFQSAFNPPASLGVDTFQSQGSPRLEYYLGRTYQALGKSAEAHDAFLKSIKGVDDLSGDRDSWSSENFFMVLSLERLGRHDDAIRLSKHFEVFAETEKDSTNPVHRAAARYLLALINKYQGQSEEAVTLLNEALNAEPDLLAARLELRGDAIDPLVKVN